MKLSKKINCNVTEKMFSDIDECGKILDVIPSDVIRNALDIYLKKYLPTPANLVIDISMNPKQLDMFNLLVENMMETVNEKVNEQMS